MLWLPGAMKVGLRNHADRTKNPAATRSSAIINQLQLRLSRNGPSQPAGYATDLISVYWSNPAMPFWRPTPLAL